ncbi:MAG: ribose-phosphate pyrophosphokinase [Bacteroidales bacterium]|nr:ribose-phosphate pyrophosphokinase [Bacteroidales bacterium]
MIKINGKEFNFNKFPDGTPLLKSDIDLLKSKDNERVTITWHFESNEEMVILMFLTRHLQKNGFVFIDLVMPYIPNARQDRVKSSKDVFTLKYFAEFINNLWFNSVTVLDPHSSVSEVLFDNLIVENPNKYINKTMANLGGFELVAKSTRKPLMVFYPDEGAMKRYSDSNPMAYAFGIKKRDWESGKILGLDVAGSTDLSPMSDILIIDDISSRGGTFYHSAKKLKELGANKIFLYVTHCEPTILDGEIFKSGLIDKVFTTNSIFNAKAMEKAKELGVAEMIEVFEYEKD